MLQRTLQPSTTNLPPSVLRRGTVVGTRTCSGTPSANTNVHEMVVLIKFNV